MARRWRANEEPEVPYGPSDTLADPV
jgi:hypothetical protein